MLRGCESKVCVQVNSDAAKASCASCLHERPFHSPFMHCLQSHRSALLIMVLWSINLVSPHKLTRHFNGNSKVTSSVLSAHST